MAWPAIVAFFVGSHHAVKGQQAKGPDVILRYFEARRVWLSRFRPCRNSWRRGDLFLNQIVPQSPQKLEREPEEVVEEEPEDLKKRSKARV